jgi:hypothetical protein
MAAQDDAVQVLFREGCTPMEKSGKSGGTEDAGATQRSRRCEKEGRPKHERGYLVDHFKRAARHLQRDTAPGSRHVTAALE